MQKVRFDALDKILYLFEDIRFLPRALFTGRFSAASFITCSRLRKVIDTPELIIDAGANVGQFSSSAAAFFPEALMHSFEPLVSCFEALKTNTKKVNNISAHNFALGLDNRRIKFYVNSDEQSSSALKTTALRLEIFPGKHEVEEVQVDQISLDSFFEVGLDGANILLKIDVQGLEEQVLQGAIKILPSIRYVLLEASVKPMYEGELGVREMIDVTEKLGFKLVSFINASRSPITKAFIEFDLLFEACERTRASPVGR
jgi:FkbM family methyltransferase